MENSQNIQTLFYEISGPLVLEDRMPLYEVISTLRDYMNIIDRSYLTLSGGDRLTKKDREKYKIIAYRFKPGSLNIDLAIELIDITQQTLPFLMPTGAIGLWNLVKATFNYIKIYKELRANDIEPKVIEDNSIKDMKIENNRNISINPNIIINAEKIEDSVVHISSFVQPGIIDNVSLHDQRKEGLTITDKEKKLFNPETIIDDNPETITVNIYRLDKESLKGKLHILEGMELIDIAFQIIGDQDISPYIDALKLDSVRVTILKELAKSVSGKQYVSRLQLINLPDITPTQKKLF